jgi:hypothetical protein
MAPTTPRPRVEARRRRIICHPIVPPLLATARALARRRASVSPRGYLRGRPLLSAGEAALRLARLRRRARQIVGLRGEPVLRVRFAFRLSLDRPLLLDVRRTPKASAGRRHG